ncbi:MAG: hypothetical protein O3A33_11145 [Chloroflexi bacterium]|nr:hypothetical protein [Chloroflexota bacterium]
MSIQSGKKVLYSQSGGSFQARPSFDGGLLLNFAFAKPEIRTIRLQSSSEVLAAVAGDLRSNTAA